MARKKQIILAQVIIDAADLRKRLREALSGEWIDKGLKDSKNLLIQATKQNFERSQAPDGSPWQALAARTLARHPTGKPLMRTLKMYNSTEVESNKGKLRLYNTAPYSEYHQQGYNSKKRRLPRRAFLGFSAVSLRQMVELLEQNGVVIFN